MLVMVMLRIIAAMKYIRARCHSIISVRRKLVSMASTFHYVFSLTESNILFLVFLVFSLFTYFMLFRNSVFRNQSNQFSVYYFPLFSLLRFQNSNFQNSILYFVLPFRASFTKILSISEKKEMRIVVTEFRMLFYKI